MTEIIGCILLFATIHNLNPPDIQNTIQTGLEYAYIDEYDSALVFFQGALDQHPENPAGYFFCAALLQVRMMDGCHYDHEDEYLALLFQAIDKAEAILAIEENTWARFYLGSCYTYRAVYEGLKKNYFETFTYGVRGGKLLKEVIAQDPHFYDAYLGAGTYEYFWARAARYLPVLNIGGGDVAEAVHKIEIAADSSLFSRPTAYNSLAFIYGEEKDYSKAIATIDGLLETYPSSRTFQWTKAGLEMKQKQYASAALIYEVLHDTYLALDNPNYANCAQCKLLEGTCLYELKEYEAARQALKTVINYTVYTDRFPIIKSYSREAYGLLARIY